MNFFKTIGCLVFIVVVAIAGCSKGPSCEDGKQNFGERGVDCSGPCPDRCDCFDGVANFGEEGVDCGGPFCKPCTSCSDGLQNGDETDIDCGGENCPPCEVSCPEELANLASYTIDNSDFVSGSANAFINDNCELLIITKNADGSGVFQISQTKPGFGVDSYDIRNRSVTFMFIQHNSRSYNSEINGSEGFFEITEFVNETDCKYFSASFNVVLTNSGGLKLNIAGLLEDVDFIDN